jgi:catechol 2,3-dioxygenase-like lactoylglutathione lyase family enzyme
MAWDWTRRVVDHLDLHASDFRESVRFYETVLAPLGIPKLFEHEGTACFTHVNVVARDAPTTNLHLCFWAESGEQVDAFHAAGVAGGFRSNGAPGYRDYDATSGIPGTARDTFVTGTVPHKKASQLWRESDTGRRGVTAPRLPDPWSS